jgi:hypothetical protein
MGNRVLGLAVLVAMLIAPGITVRTQEGPSVLEYRGDNIYYGGSSKAVKGDISPALRDITPVLGGPTKTDKDDADTDLMGPCGLPEQFDPVAQTCVGGGNGRNEAMPAPGATWDAWTNLCSCSPPDPVGDVGPNHYVAMSNSTIGIYTKTGTLLWGPSNINTIWSGFGGACQTENAGDPVVLYDQFADRWLVSQFTAAGPTYYNCVALSTSGDPTGTWQRYAFSNGTSFPDYPKYGIWADGYYFSTRNTSGTTGQGAYALNRTQMLAGSLTPTVVNFLLAPGSTAYYGGDGLLPADIDGSAFPPAGTPQFFIGTMDNGGPYSAPYDAIYIYKFHVDWTTPANSTFTKVSPDISVAAFTSIFAPCSGGRACISQPGTTNKLDILSYRQRPTFRAAYRNFGTHESIVTNQSVAGTATVAGVRWYELRDPNGSPFIYQQGTYVPGATDGTHRWMGSVAMDMMGDMAIGFSASSGTVYPSSWYTGRLVGDSLGTMPQGEASIITGTGSQTGSNRWGDYTSINVDPTDDCTFWYVNQYIPTTSSIGWRLRVGSFKFPSCGCTTPGVPTKEAASVPGDNQITVSWTLGSPAGATYKIYRAMGDCTSPGAFSLIASGVTGSPYTDNTVSGTVTYAYKVSAVDSTGGCESAQSGCVYATATGPCNSLPTFGGITGVTNPGLATCRLNLTWTAGTAHCGGPIYYSVYRSTSSSFTPGPANQIATGVTGTSYADTSALANGTPYYYIVHAVDSSNGAEDANLVTLSVAPTGPFATGTWSDDAGDTGTAKMTMDPSWSVLATGGKTLPQVYATGAYADNSCMALTAPILLLGTGSILSFASKYGIETDWDAGILEVATAPTFTNWTKLNITTYPNGLAYAANSCGIPASGANTVFSLTNAAPTYPTGPYTGSLSAYNGQQVRLRWILGSDTSVNSAGWWIDDISITNVQVPGTCATAGAVKPVPDGNWISGTPIKASKNTGDGSSLDLTWDVTTCVDTDYNAYYGVGSQVSSYTLTSSECTLGNSGSATWNPAPAVPGGETFLWWIIVGTDGVQTESSWGKDSAGNERHPAASAQCGFTAKSTATTCP